MDKSMACSNLVFRSDGGEESMEERLKVERINGILCSIPGIVVS